MKTGNSNNLLLGVCYRSPNSPLNAFLEYWAQLLNFISSAQQDTWISGDFNIIMNSNNTVSSRFRTICSSNGFRILDHGPTRTEGTTSNTLDIVITNICKNTTSVTLETGVTDHATVISSIDATVEKITKREEDNIWSYNEEAIIADLQSETFKDCLEISDLNTAVLELTTKIGNICSNHINQRRLQYKYEAAQSQWMTRGILKSLRTQRKLFKKLKKKPNDQLQKKEFTTYRNTLTNTIRAAKKSNIHNRLTWAKGDAKKTWQILNEVRGAPKIKLEGPASIKEINNNRKTHPEDIANYAINNLFPRRDENHTYKGDNMDKIHRNNKTIFLKPVTLTEIDSIINSLKSTKSLGMDRIPISIIKRLHNINYSIWVLCNRMLQEGIFPNCLKKGIIKLKYKKGNRDELKNYRPITILNSISKIFEKVLKTRITNFATECDMISKEQFGFKKGVSTEDAVLYLTTKIQGNITKGNTTMAMSLDISKAFDSIPHDILFRKLEKKGIRGKALQLIKSFMEKRELVVEVQNTWSKVGILKIGLPQGSILSPILFLIFIDDIHNLQGPGEIISFADDNFSFYSSTNPVEDIHIFQTWLTTINNWYEENGLNLNLKKCSFIIFGSRKKVKELRERNLTVELAGINFKMEETVKYLGLILDNFLSWEDHIDYILRKVAYWIPLYYRIRWEMREESLIFLLKTIVIPQMFYGLKIFGGANKTKVKSLQTFMNKLIRIMLQINQRESLTEIYHLKKLKNIKELYIAVMCKHAIALQNEHINPTDFILIKKTRTRSYELRKTQQTLLQELIPNKESERRYFNFRLTKILNGIAQQNPTFMDPQTLSINREYFNVNKWIKKLDIGKLWDKI